jgi:glyoxylase-like metal-dependent hydrolase (beta-lactamase superfamily II)
MIIKALPGRILGSNCYIVASEKTGKGLIIDPSADADAIQEIVSELKLSISLMVATHSHIDHILEVAKVKQKLNVILAVHEAEANMELWSRD